MNFLKKTIIRKEVNMLKQISIFFVLLFLVSSLQGQSYLGKQHSFSLNTQEMMKVFDGGGDLEKVSAYYFKMTYPEALKAIKAKGVNPSVDDGKIYVDGKKFRYDSNQDGEKITMIMNLETKIMYNVDWARKEYMEIDIEKMKKMRDQMQKQMATQMQGMGAYMDKLPPEARKKIEAMQKGKMPGNDEQAEVSATGKTKTINTFKCKEYIIHRDNKNEQVWVSKQYTELQQMFKNMDLTIGDKEDSKNGVWEKIDGWPVHQVDVDINMMHGQGSVNYDEVYSIEKTTHKSGTFDPPTGFKKTTMEDKMKGFKGFSPGN